MPGISLDLIQTVALGDFNPRIVRPSWLTRQGVCKEEELRAVEFLPGEGSEGAVVYRLGRREWQVDYDRLSVAVSQPKTELPDDPAADVARVIGLLPHTPVRVVGHNFHFSCLMEEWNGWPLPQLGSKIEPAASGWKPAQTRWTGSYLGDGVWIEVTAEADRGAGFVVLLFNHDRATDPEKHVTALAAAGKLRDDATTTARMLNDLFGIHWTL